MTNNLKAGDVIYRFYQGIIEDKLVIERITKTQAISGNHKFSISYRGENVYLIGTGGVFNSFKIETNQLKEEYRKKEIISTLKRYDYNEVEIETLEKMYNILINGK